MRAIAIALLVSCGDNRPEIEVFEPTNGKRLMIEQYQFDDGTRLVQPTAFYDRRLHARCTKQTWIDDIVRCVPDAEEAFYREDTCTTLFGRATKKFPTHFIARDTKDLPETPFVDRWPARVFEVAAKADPIATYFLREGTDSEGMPICTGPHNSLPDDESTQYYDLGGEVGGEDLEPISETEIGVGRLGLVIRQSDDGAVVPLGFRDRDLDIPCTPAPRGEAGICEPSGVADAGFFADNACTQPAILVAGEIDPAVARTKTSDGCFAYHVVDPNQAPRAYRDNGVGCALVPTTLRVLPVGPAVELATITRVVDDAPKRRIQRILASDGDLHVYADRTFDTATRAECQLAMVGETLRCLPPALAPIVRLFQPGCTVERRLAEVPERVCELHSFAVNYTGETLELHAIGDPFEGTAYTFGPFGCQPYTPTPGSQLHDVGPLLPDDTFVGAVPFGAR